MANYQKGDVLRFNQDFQKHGIKQHQYYTVGQMTKKHRQDNVLPLIDEQGKTERFALQSLPQYKTHTAPFERIIELYRSDELELNVGDKLMWTRNFKSSNVRNGDTLTLHAIQDKELLFITKENNTMIFEKNHPALKHFDYSYVLTNYKVQGKDASYGIGLMESHNRFGSTLKNFYVQISRAVHGMTLVTDDKNCLIGAIKRNNDEKQASIDVISARQLVDHRARFNDRAPISIEPVIDKKMRFEKEMSINALLKN